MSLFFSSELVFQSSFRSHHCEGLDVLVCSFHIHSYAALPFGFDSLQRQASPYANIIQQMQSVQLMFPTVTLLSESWPRQETADKMRDINLCGVVQQVTHMHSGWMQLIFSRCKTGCN